MFVLDLLLLIPWAEAQLIKPAPFVNLSWRFRARYPYPIYSMNVSEIPSRFFLNVEINSLYSLTPLIWLFRPICPFSLKGSAKVIPKYPFASLSPKCF
jgi:hypothetical protein